MQRNQKKFADRYILNSDYRLTLSNNESHLYRAFDDIEEKDVIIKLFNSHDSLYTQYHDKILNLRHPNLVHYLYISNISDESTEKRNIIVREWIDGEPITSHFRKYPSIVSFAKILLQVLDCLDYLHSKDILHLDIKPSNILIELGRTSPIAKVIDLESVHFLNNKLNKKNITPEYTAPELLRANNPTVQCDYWSLGCLVFELFIGYPPFGIRNENGNFSAILDNIENKIHLKKIKFLPDPFRLLIESCLQEDVDERIHDISSLKIYLNRC